MGKRRDIKIAEMVGKPIGEKMESLAEVVRSDGEKIRSEYKGQIDGVKKIVDVMLEDLSAREKKDIYDLNTLIDIASLEHTESRFLVEMLYTLANMTEQVTKIQQAFVRSIQNYLCIQNVQTMINPSFIENIENISVQKAILQVVMEFLFLENNDHGYLDEYEDVLSYFSVNKNSILQIQTAISNIYVAIGAQGLVEKYGFRVEDVRKSVPNNDINDLKNIINEWRNIEFISLQPTYALTKLLYHTLKMHYYEEDIKTMSACRRKAEATLKNAYNEASSLLVPYGFNNLCTLLKKEFFEDYLERDITRMQHIIRKLRDSDSPNDKIDMIESYINSTDLQEKISETLHEEISDSYYRIGKFESYTSLIECTEWDMTGMETKGLFKLIAAAAGNVYYQYNCSEAWNKINEEISSKVEMFAESCAKAVKNLLLRKCIEPVEFLLQEL